MTRQLFIYWKTPAATADQAQAQAAAMQADLLLALPRLQARLFRRAEADTGTVTLMETYAMPDADLGPELQARIEQAALSITAWCPQGRHVEVFDEQLRALPRDGSDLALHHDM